MIFLTNGRTWLGPYEVGEPGIARGTNTLREQGGEVRAVSADSLDAAREVLRRATAKR